MGKAKINIKTFMGSDDSDVELFGNDSKSIGKVYFKYVTSKLDEVPLLFIKNITCDFRRETKFLAKAVKNIQYSRNHILKFHVKIKR